MPCGIADNIRFGLDNTAADDAFGQLTDQNFPNKIAGKRGGIRWQPRARERRTAVLMAISLHEIRSTHCAREAPGSNGSAKYWVSRATFPSRNSMMLTV